MTRIVEIGRSERDIIVLFDFVNKRGIVRANTSFISDGVPLETIDPGPHGFGPGMVLVTREWKKIYFVNERQNWVAQSYFHLAERLMKEKRIFNP